MIDLDDLTAFVAVVRAGSFTAAAGQLGTQKSQLSRVIARLEARLQVRLLQRTTRSLALTEAGRDLYERALGILAALEATEAALARQHQAPRGTLRVSCAVELGLVAVGGWVAQALRAHPDLRIELELTNRLVDLVHEGVDVAIRIGELPDSGLSARRLGVIDYGLYAAPGWLAGVGAPRDPSALAGLPLIQFAPFAPSAPQPWVLLGPEGARATVTAVPRLLVTNSLAARDAAAQGLGLALLPRYLAAPLVKAGALVATLPGWSRAPVPVQAVFASSRYLTPKVRAFVDLAVTGFARDVAGGEPPALPQPPG